MPTRYDAAMDIAAAAVEKLSFDLEQDQISCVFRLDELISESISEYVNNLVYTSDIVELWSALGWPEPDESAYDGQTIVQQMSAAIEDALRDDDKVADTVNLDVNTWATEELEKRHTDFTDLDEDDTEELVQLLA